MLENKKGLAGLLAKAADGAETLGGKLAGLEAKLAKLLDDQAAWQANSGKANGRQGAQEFVTNGEMTKLKVHCVGSDGFDLPRTFGVPNVALGLLFVGSLGIPV